MEKGSSLGRDWWQQRWHLPRGVRRERLLGSELRLRLSPLPTLLAASEESGRNTVSFLPPFCPFQLVGNRLIVFSCVAVCGKGYYADEAQKRCKQCHGGCDSCSGPDHCDTCPPGYYLVEAHLDHLHNRQCLERCPADFVIDRKRLRRSTLCR